MNMPQEISSEAQTETTPVSANENVKTFSVVEFSRVRHELARLKEQADAVVRKIGDIEALLAHAAVEAVTCAPDEKADITVAPAVIGVPKKSQDALRKFHKVSDANPIVYLGVYEDPRIGRPLNLFTAPENFIASADEAMYVKIPSLKASKDGKGYDGMKIDRSHIYGDQFVENLRSGKGLKKWCAMPWPVVAGSDDYDTPIFFADNLKDNWDKGDLAQATSIANSGSFHAQCFGSVTPNRYAPGYVLVAHRRRGDIYDAHRRGGRVRWLPVLAQELSL